MIITDAQIRTWANHHGCPIPDNQPLPETLREKYRQARHYMIRRPYAMRNRKNRVTDQ